MRVRSRLWLFVAFLYALFFVWYTDLKGPLTEPEIQDYKARLVNIGMAPERIWLIEQFMREDTGRHFIMVNNLDLNASPPDVEGAQPGESAEQLMARYMQYMFPAMLARASHPVFSGNAVHTSMDLVGIEGAEKWDSAALVRYRSRRDLMEIASNPEFRLRHPFKTAALEKTIAFPVEPVLHPGDPRLLLFLLLIAVTALIDALWLSRRN